MGNRYYKFEVNGKKYRLDTQRFAIFCICVMLIWAFLACLLINYRCSKNVPSYTYSTIEKSDPIDFSVYDDMAREMPLVSTSPVKRYMDRNAVTDKSTQNYKICHNADLCDDGTLEYCGRKVIAIGQAYGMPGDKLDITLLRENGEEYVMEAVVGDVKKNKDTLNGEGFIGEDGHVIEMVVDTGTINNLSKKMGDMNYTPSVEGSIIGITKADI